MEANRDDIKEGSFFRKIRSVYGFQALLRGGRPRRALSSSYALKPGDADYDAYVDALNELYFKYEENGRVRVENATHLYFGTV